MSFIIYDVETTGLAKRFDQIVQFAAVLTDSNLNVKDEIEIGCRLMPHVIPSPEAMIVTGLRIEQLLDTSLSSHYEMVVKVRRTLESWTPALFLGFNSLSFDEEFLRQAFYLCLYNPYLTNTQGNSRADVLSLCRMAAALSPDIIRTASSDNGRKIFRLKQLAETNGIVSPISHSSMADVSTTLSLCRLIKEEAPDVWSQFLKFSQKATVESFITDEDAFVVSETFGNHHRTRVVTSIGKNDKQPTRHYCLDISANLSLLNKMSDDELVNLCRSPGRPIVTVRTNAAPTLWALYEAPQELLGPFEGEVEILDHVERIRENGRLLKRIRDAAQAAEPDYPPSTYLEEQIYGFPFPSQYDDSLMREFHSATWEERVELAGKFSDSRYRQLSLRLIYFEQPNLLGIERKHAFEDAIRKRLMAAPDAGVPWRSIPAAIRESEGLLASDQNDEVCEQEKYLNYLNKRAEVFPIL